MKEATNPWDQFTAKPSLLQLTKEIYLMEVYFITLVLWTTYNVITPLIL